MALAATDIVSPRITGDPAVALPSAQGQQIKPSILQAQPPTFGNVLTFSGPATVRVLWDNTLDGSILAAALADTNLDRITDGEATEVQRLLGGPPSGAVGSAPKWVRHKAPRGDSTTDPSGGTSRSYDGRVVSVYRRTPAENAAEDGDTYCTIKTDDGAYFEDVSTEFVVDPTR
jgi:hypothetical protein